MRARQWASPIAGCSRGERALSSATMEGSPPLSLSFPLPPCEQPAPAPVTQPNPGLHAGPERCSCADLLQKRGKGGAEGGAEGKKRAAGGQGAEQDI